MNCPRCGNELRISRKDPRFGLCDTCRKKYRFRSRRHHRFARKRRSTIQNTPIFPQKSVREKRRQRCAGYDELLAIGREEREGKRGLFGPPEEIK